MSNIFFLYAKNDILLLGGSMVKPETINDKQLPIIMKMFANAFSHIPTETKVVRETKLGQIIAQTNEVYHGNYQINKYLHFDKYDKIIAAFHERLVNNFGHCNLSLFYQNFKNLKLKERNKNILDYLSILITLLTLLYL